MPKARPLTQKQREQEAIEKEVDRACKDFLLAIGMKRGVEEKTYTQIAEEIGIHRNTLLEWRKGELPDARFAHVVEAYARMGYRLVLEPINSSKK